MKPTTNKIIRDWLLYKLQMNNDVVYSHDFETDLVKYGEMFWGVKKLPSAYSREWRKIRASQSYKDIGISNIESVKTKGNEGKWKLITSI